MARINVENSWWTDPRREALSKLIGDELMADGAAIRLWRLAQEYWLKNREHIPEHVFEHVRYRSELVRCGLVVVHEHTVYVRGSSNAFTWIDEAKEKASKAGKISAQKRKEKYGSASPNVNARRTNVRTDSEHVRTPSNTLEHPSNSLSSSSSLSSSIKGSKSLKTNVGIRLDYPPEFDNFWRLYSSKGDKKASYVQYQKLNLSQEDKDTLAIAISNYTGRNPDPKFRKDFERFLQMDWRENAKTVSNGLHPQTQERLNTLERFKQREEERAFEIAKGVSHEN